MLGGFYMSDENNLNNMTDEERQAFEKENHPNTIEYRRIQAQIQHTIQEITEKMNRLHFTDDEKKEILNIIEYHSVIKEAAKQPLIKINENCILEEVEDKVKDNFKKISENMLKALNDKMKEIMDRKLNK